MLVKTAHKDFPQQLLGVKKFECGERDRVKLLSCHFRDIKIKDFISTSSTSIPGKPRLTKHHGLVNRPQVAEQYLQAAAAINIYNHNWSGRAASFGRCLAHQKSLTETASWDTWFLLYK